MLDEKKTKLALNIRFTAKLKKSVIETFAFLYEVDGKESGAT
jgi:hypothetical protein